MANYKAPAQEISFVIDELLDFKQLRKIPEFAEASPEICLLYTSPSPRDRG